AQQFLELVAVHLADVERVLLQLDVRMQLLVRAGNEREAAGCEHLADPLQQGSLRPLVDMLDDLERGDEIIGCGLRLGEEGIDVGVREGQPGVVAVSTGGMPYRLRTGIEGIDVRSARSEVSGSVSFP